MLEKYIEVFSNLNTDKAKARWTAATMHRAPHKPLLLLSILDLFAEGAIVENLIQPDIELSEIFAHYWTIVMPPEKEGNMS